LPRRLAAAVEVVVGSVCVFGYIWFVSPLRNLWIQAGAALPIVAFLILANCTIQTRARDLGFRWDNWRDSAKDLTLFTTITMPVLFILWSGYFPTNFHLHPDARFWKKLARYPFWALFQQYLILGFFFRRYREIFAPHATPAILLSACTFALIHIPNPPLIIFCFVAGIVWAVTYHRHPNLYTIAISHAILAIFCSQVLLVSLKVGPEAEAGRWSKTQSLVWPERGGAP